MPIEKRIGAELPARILALMVAANGRIDERELKALDGLDAYRRVGVGRERFIALARTCLEDIGSHLSEHSWLSTADMNYIDTLVDDVKDRELQLMLCRLAASTITADGHISEDERMVYHHVLARWHVSQGMVTQAILHDKAH